MLCLKWVSQHPAQQVSDRLSLSHSINLTFDEGFVQSGFGNRCGENADTVFNVSFCCREHLELRTALTDSLFC